MAAEVRRGDIEPLCPFCAFARIHGVDEVEFRVHPAQVGELLARRLLGPVDAMVTRLNRIYRR